MSDKERFRRLTVVEEDELRRRRKVMEDDVKYWISAKVCARFVSKSQAVVIVKIY